MVPLPHEGGGLSKGVASSFFLSVPRLRLGVLSSGLGTSSFFLDVSSFRLDVPSSRMKVSSFLLDTPSFFLDRWSY